MLLLSYPFYFLFFFNSKFKKAQIILCSLYLIGYMYIFNLNTNLSLYNILDLCYFFLFQICSFYNNINTLIINKNQYIFKSFIFYISYLLLCNCFLSFRYLCVIQYFLITIYHF